MVHAAPNAITDKHQETQRLELQTLLPALGRCGYKQPICLVLCELENPHLALEETTTSLLMLQET